MSFVSCGQLPNILKKAIYMKKVNSLIRLLRTKKTRERFHFSTQPRSEILFDLDYTCQEEL